MEALVHKYNYRLNFALLIFMQKVIDTIEYTYHLPEDRIALHPLGKRDQSRLLVCQEETISHHQFVELPQLLPKNAALFFNDTKVIPARLLFQKETGATIEIFLLQPADRNQPVQLAMEAKGKAKWQCTIGNLKRWKQKSVLEINHNGITVEAFKESDEVVQFNWEPSDLTFAEIIDAFGETPLPPYINRKPEAEDKWRYQTVYSHYEGAVAAPTAGLHFSDHILDELKQLSIPADFLTLHVSAGTFQPIKTKNAAEHTMHAEQMVVSKASLEHLLNNNKKIVAVGTTSMRTLESLYWYGVKILKEGTQAFNIGQGYPYQHDNSNLPNRYESIQAVLHTMQSKEKLVGSTSIYIVPGYQFKMCQGLITNFHQPGSTLMLLVAAFMGPIWKSIYEKAIQENYRFLSYGDSSLLIPS
jgi:S-adenosylmethionine:tRNA ribosyltransferase-isomerase